jgi:hypothetical protein
MSQPQVERAAVLFAFQRALLGEVFPALRAIAVDWTETGVSFVAYVDGPLDEKDATSLSSVAAEVAADFPAGVDVDYDVIRCDAPAPILDSRLRVFQRRESAD